MRRIYLDHAAGTALRPEALERMLPLLERQGPNASSLHEEARAVLGHLDDARMEVAEVLHAHPSEIVFTSGGTEAINEAIKSVAFAYSQAGAGSHVVTSEAEHQAVLNSCRYLERFGLTVTYLPVDQYALVSPEQVASALTEQTAMVSLTYVNNEVGSILNVEDIVRAIRERERALGHRIAVHLDAVQAPGYAPLDVRTLGVDIMSLSGHKFGGPVGTGVLYVRRATPFLPLIDGGVQERRRRAGTENVAGAVGLATALGLVTSERPTVEPRIRRLRDRLIERITAGLPGAKLNGHPTERAANNVNFSFAGLDGESLVLALDAQGVACSAGSACAHTTWEPSHVLLAMGCTLEEATGALRLTLGNPTTDQDIDDAGRIIVDVVRRLLSDAYTLPSQGSEWAPPTEGEASPHGSAAGLP